MNYEDSGKTDSQHNHKDHGHTKVDDDVEDKIEQVTPPIGDKTEEANRTLTEAEDCQAKHKQFVQTSKDILFDWWS